MEYEKIFGNETYDNILERKLLNVDPSLDKREGSIIYDGLAPNAIEEALLYAYLDFLNKNSFAITANREWLIQRAMERGIEPWKASRAILIGKFDVDVGINQRFSIDNKYFRTIEYIKNDDFYYYKLEAENVGSDSNLSSGNLIPSTNIKGLTVSQIVELAIPGEDEEDTEHFRERYFDEIKTNAYGGNIDDYTRKTKAIEGVGDVKVIPVWDGGGTVKLIITDAENNSPSHELVSKVQEIMDPVPHSQKGVGVAPIGHLVTVEGAKRKEINITAKLMVNKSVNLDDLIEEYLELERSKFAKKGSESLYVENDIRLTKIMSIILNTEGVIDYEDIYFTDYPDEKILVLEDNEIPYLGKIDIEEVEI